MKKGWKIALISLGSLLGLVVVVVAIALWLVFTPSQLTKIVNRIADNYLLCETHFDNVDLTLFRTFPDAGLRIDNVHVVNPTEGAPSDTVASIGSLTVGVDVKRYLKQKELVVHQVILDRVQANLYMGPDGITNFNIFPSSTEKDTTPSSFSLDSLPMMDINRVRVNGLSASVLNVPARMTANVKDLDLAVDGTLDSGHADIKVSVDGESLGVNMKDSTGVETLAALLQGVDISLKGKGGLDAVDGKLKLQVKNGTLNTGGVEMINETLQQSKRDLLCLSTNFAADLNRMAVDIKDGNLKLDDYALLFSGQAQLPTETAPMGVDAELHTDGTWQVAPLLKLVPQQYTGFMKGMELDSKIELAAKAVGTMTDSTMPVVDAQVRLADGHFYYPKALPYKLSKIAGDVDAHLNMSAGGKSHAVLKSLKAHTRNTDISVSGRADDLLGDMLVDATVKGALPLQDAMPMVPADMKLDAEGNATIDLKANFRMSDVSAMRLERIKANGTVKLSDLNVHYDSIDASSPALNIALMMPATEHRGKLADAHITGSQLKVAMPGINGFLEKPDINVGVNNPMKEQLAAAFEIEMGEAEANIDSMMVSLGALQLSGSMRMDSTQSNPLRKFNPVANIDMHSAVLYMPALPDAVRLSQFTLKYNSNTCELNTAEVKVGHSDFQLYGTVDNLEQWLDHKEILHADLNFTSSYADVDQLMDMFSGMGSDPDTIEQMRQEDNVPSEADPFLVPKDVDLTLHTHIKRSVAFGNDLNDVAGAVTIKDGVAILDQIGFVCKAATMQLTALYKSPRPNNLFVALDFHLLDIQIDELLDMIPAVDTLVPMLAAFNGNANFHLAAETFLDARYQPKMSSLLGSAAISGRDLTVLDNNTIAQIAKLMQFKSWKDKDDKIKIDSLDVELTCFRKEIEVFPFLLNIGKYQLCASGKHTLDNQCGYHVELLKNPLLAKVGVDVRGDLSHPKVSLGQVRYADLYKPEKQGVVEKRTLELKRMIKEALEANVR